ncbi:Uncharacterised protein [Salmonella enterica subsp. enterica serovar Typhimurium str. DT104]|nr:Uncharacterised protein [Salmonella enterica subsp. enterica serovar Typhimurium str. DT104]
MGGSSGTLQFTDINICGATDTQFSRLHPQQLGTGEALYRRLLFQAAYKLCFFLRGQRFGIGKLTGLPGGFRHQRQIIAL